MIVREATADDAAHLAPLVAELGYRTSANDLLGCIEKYAATEGSWAYVVEVEGRLIGAAAYHMTPYFHRRGGSLRVTALVVSEKFRRRGVGKRLLKKATELALQNGCDKTELTTGAHRAGEAHRFYDRVGFQTYAGIRYLRYESVTSPQSV